MDNKLLTIGEFAKLRNTSVKALRYYEQIGLLIPAQINPRTNYRYYDVSQLMTLDFIRFALDLNVPLKETVSYFTNSSQPDYIRMFESAKKIELEQLHKVQMALASIERMMLYLNHCEQHAYQDAIYERFIPDRYFVCEPLEDTDIIKDYEPEFGKFLLRIQEKGFYPILPSGIMYLVHRHERKPYIFCEVLENQKDMPGVQKFPAGNYLCFQQYQWGEKLLPVEFEDRKFAREESVIIDSFLIFHTRDAHQHVCETQILK